MTINHRAEAERLLNDATDNDGDITVTGEHVTATLAAAQVHATLAASETATAIVSSYQHAIHTCRFALIRHIAEGLALSDGDEAHQHALGLAKYLDSVGLNVDREVDAYIEENCGWADARAVRKPPSVRRAEWDAAHPCPFCPPADPKGDHVHEWNRAIPQGR